MPGATGGNMQPLGERKRLFAPVVNPPEPKISLDDLDARLAAQFDIQTLSAAVASAEFTLAASGKLPKAPPELEEEEERHESRSSEKKRGHKDKDRDREHRRDRSKERKRSRRDRSSERRRSRSPRRSRRSRSRSPPRRDSEDRGDTRPRRSRFDLKQKVEADTDRAGPPTIDTLQAVSLYNAGTASGSGRPGGLMANSIQINLAGTKPEPEESAADDRKKKRKSRWGAPQEKSFVPGMPTMIPSTLTEEQQRGYLLQLQIEECSRKLRTGDYGIDPDPAKRSPSPEPVYDTHGKRLNTREVRTKQKLERERHDSVQEMIKINPMYKPPADYKMPVIKLNDKVWIPQDDHPEVNFVGLLLGPRGNTLKSLEKETGARIIIRGKGSVKEGKFSKFQGPMPGEDEPLHAYITSTDPEVIKTAVEKIKTILEQAVEIPDSQNELRKLQLRELALLNGTLRPEDLMSGNRCSNCGANTHKTWECPDAPNVTANIICTACGGAGHLTRDCRNPKPGSGLGGFGKRALGLEQDMSGGLDEEYSALMAELGQDTGGSASVKIGGGLAVKRGPFGRFMAQNMANQNRQGPGHQVQEQMMQEQGGFQGGPPQRRRPEPIVRINLAKQGGGPPGPPTGPGGVPKPLMSLDVSSPAESGGPSPRGRNPQAGGPNKGPQMPPWGGPGGMWPPIPPGMMMPPMPGQEGKEGGMPPWGMPPMGMMPGMMGMVPPPPPSEPDGTPSGGKKPLIGQPPASQANPMGMGMPPFMQMGMGMGMPPMMPFNMGNMGPPMNQGQGDKGGPAPVPPPPPSMDYSSMLAPPPPPPPPPE